MISGYNIGIKPVKLLLLKYVYFSNSLVWEIFIFLAQKITFKVWKIKDKNKIWFNNYQNEMNTNTDHDNFPFNSE